MNQSEIYAQIVANIELMNASFEFWITGTFAVLVAFHFAAEKISAYFHRMIILLYSLLTFLQLLRIANSMYAAGEYVQRLSEQGLEPYPSSPVAALSPLLYLSVVVLGFFGTVIFAKNSIASDESDESDT